MLYADAGTTWTKIIEINSGKSDFNKHFAQYVVKADGDRKYYIIPSSVIRTSNVEFDRATGHMAKIKLKDGKNYVNEVIALARGFQAHHPGDGIVLDLGSRDVKWVKFKNNKFKDLDWNNSCASATGATVEMLLKFYDVKIEDLEPVDEKYIITCGIFGLERIMDDIANGEAASVAISKFIHGIAHNAWAFAKNPEEIYLSGGFCDNECFVECLKTYTKVFRLGRFTLVQGLLVNSK